MTIFNLVVTWCVTFVLMKCGPLRENMTHSKAPCNLHSPYRRIVQCASGWPCHQWIAALDHPIFPVLLTIPFSWTNGTAVLPESLPSEIEYISHSSIPSEQPKRWYIPLISFQKNLTTNKRPVTLGHERFNYRPFFRSPWLGLQAKRAAQAWGSFSKQLGLA